MGERPVAVIVPAPGTAGPTEEDVLTFVAAYVADGHISRYAVPDRIVVQSELPRTSVGKIDKKLLRQRQAGPENFVPDAVESS
ncbi:hypothetical protein V2V90_25080 (plasmid) [Agrobacterium leguminum]|uniref:AMP-binding enzyme n=1 Tax=Agrobacterium leguminum TaxID=2792015 RepID=UPI0030D1BDBA